MTIVTLQPTNGIDTRISEELATNNYGINTSIGAGNNSIPTEHRGLIKFDLSSVPAGVSIVSATLSLYCITQSTSTDYNVSIHRSLVQWYEGSQNGAAPTAGQDGSTWNLRNANGSVAWAGGAGGASGSDWDATATDATLITTTGQYFDWDVAADVQDFIDSVHTNHGWWVIGDPASSSFKSFVASDDFASRPDQIPVLVIEYLDLDTDMVGSSEGTATVTGLLTGDGRLVGETSGVAIVSGTLISNAISGSTAGIATVTGILKATSTLEGSVTGQSTVVGILKGDGHLAGIIEGVATVSGNGGFEGQLRGSASGTATTLSTLHVYARHVARASGCFADPLLYITDGTVKASGQLNLTNLLDAKVGYLLDKWRPALAQYKEGGSWSDSPQGTGRRLTKRVFGNAIEVFGLKARGYNQDHLFSYLTELLHWQEAAADYETSDWADRPVYLVAKGPHESNPRYAHIYMMSIAELENPYAQPLFPISNPALEELTLRVERGDWMSNPPGQYECVAISSVRSWTVAGWSSGS